MNNVLFYLIFAIILYLVLSRVFEKFNIEQENFDPSLVPVSSIITLAKVAQKLVNGNGVLTNPGSLQIGGSPSAPGNLMVTGLTELIGSGGSGTNPALKVMGATTINGSTLGPSATALNVIGSMSVNKSVVINPIPGSSKSAYSITTNSTTSNSGDYFYISSPSKTGLLAIEASGADAYFNVDTAFAKKNLNVGGDITLAQSAGGSINVKGRTDGNITQIYSYDGDSGIKMYSNVTSKDIFQVDKNGNVTVPGNTNIGNSLTLNNASSNFITINESSTVDKGSVRIWKDKGSGRLTFVGQNATNSDYSWPGVVIDTNNSLITTSTLNANTATANTVTAVALNVKNNNNGLLTEISAVNVDSGIKMYSFESNQDIFKVDKGGNVTVPGNLSVPSFYSFATINWVGPSPIYNNQSQTNIKNIFSSAPGYSRWAHHAIITCNLSISVINNDSNNGASMTPYFTTDDGKSSLTNDLFHTYSCGPQWWFDFGGSYSVTLINGVDYTTNTKNLIFNIKVGNRMIEPKVKGTFIGIGYIP